MQVAAKEDGLDCFAHLGESSVSWVLEIVAREATQDGLGFRSAKAQRGGVFHHLVVLLADQFPVDRGCGLSDHAGGGASDLL